MPETVEFRTVEEATAAIVALRTEARTQAERSAGHDLAIARNEKALTDLVAANRVLQEQANRERMESRPVVEDEAQIGRRYGSEDGATLRLFGGRERVEYCGEPFDIEVPGLLDDPEPICQWQRDLRESIAQRAWARLALKDLRSSPTPYLDGQVVRHLRSAPRHVREPLQKSFGALAKNRRLAPMGAVTKAFYDVAGSGGEWIPDGFMADLYQAFMIPRNLAAQFTTVPVLRDTTKRPTLSTGLRPYIKSKITTDDPAKYTPSTVTTSEQSITVPGLAVRTLIDDAADEDSAILVGQVLRREVINGLDDGYEDAMVNGDTTAAHEDAIATWNARSRWGLAGLGGSADHRRVFKGLRRLAVDATNTTDQSAAKTAAGYLAARAKLAERAVGRVMCVVSPEYLMTMFGWDEVETVEKFGPNATIVKGSLGMLFGNPIVLSRFVTADLATTGLFVTSTDAYTGFILVDADAYYNYERRGALVEADKEIVSGHIELVATLRRLFSSPDAGATKNVHWSFKM